MKALKSNGTELEDQLQNPLVRQHRILITGGAGYLGSAIIPDLLAAGYHVTVVDDFRYGQSSLNHLCFYPNFEVVRGDVRLGNVMRPLMQCADVIIPLAGLVGAPLCAEDPFTAATVNHDALVMMFSGLSNDQIVIMPTTNSAYGSGDADNMCTEETPLNPLSDYANQKVQVEGYLMKFENSISYRLATVFGMSPRMRIDLLVNDFVYRAVNDRFIVLYEADFKRNYIHVRDVSRALQHALINHEKMKGNIYNVGLSDANLSKLELAERIKKQVPDFEIVTREVGKDPDQRNYIVSTEKLKATGFEAVVGLDIGIAELIKGYRMLKNTRYGNV